LKYYYFYNTDIGKLLIEEDEGNIIRITLANDELEKSEEKETEIIKEANRQIQEYLKGKRKKFELPIKLEGTEFQKRVWKELCNIPYGQTKTYGEIAKLIGNSKAARAVGMANHNNPIMIVIPCHRVIGSNKKLVGYALGLDIKEKLLKIEGFPGCI